MKGSEVVSPAQGALRPRDNPSAGERDRVQEVVRAWDRALRSYLLYEGKNAAVERVQRGLEQQMEALWDRLSALTITVEETSLSWNAETVLATEPGSDSLPFLLYRDGLRELTFLPGCEREELSELVKLLARLHRVRGEEEDLLTLLWEGDWPHLRYRYVDPPVEGLVLPQASASAGAPVAPPAERESSSGAPVIAPEEFRSALYVLSEREMQRVEDDLTAEMERKLTDDVVAGLLDRLEDSASDRQARIVAILADLLPTLLGAGKIEAAVRLLDELAPFEVHAGLPPDVREQVRAVRQRLAEPEVLEQVIRAVKEMPDPDTTLALQALLGSVPPCGLRPLARLAAGIADPGVHDVVWEAVARLASTQPQGVAELLADPDPALAAGGARLAGRLGLVEQGPAVIRLLGGNKTELRLAAIDAVRQLRSARATAALQALLGDTDREVRIAAVRTLGELRYGPAAEALAGALDSKQLREADLTERIAWHEAYGSVAGEEGVAGLARTLNGRGWLGRRESPEHRACAALGLGRIASPAARAALASAAADPDPIVRNAVGRALRGGGV